MNPKVKVVTKAALAKKVIKKNIQANQKIQFDDHGTVLPNETMKKSEIGQKYEQEEITERSGIDVSRVKEVLKAEDKFDKQLAKEKRKAKKREEKLKKQENSKRNQQQTVSVFGNICLFACKIINFGYIFFQTLQGGDENDTSDSENEDNLDWLPDPDKIYGEGSTDQADLEQKDSSEEESDEE